MCPPFLFCGPSLKGNVVGTPVRLNFLVCADGRPNWSHTIDFIKAKGGHLGPPLQIKLHLNYANSVCEISW